MFIEIVFYFGKTIINKYYLSTLYSKHIKTNLVMLVDRYILYVFLYSLSIKLLFCSFFMIITLSPKILKADRYLLWDTVDTYFIKWTW